MKRKSASIVVLLTLLLSPLALAQTDSETTTIYPVSDANRTDLKRINGYLETMLKISGAVGMCSPETQEAARFTYGIVMGEADDSYRAGEPIAVFIRNEGLLNYFASLLADHAEMARDKVLLFKRIQELDRLHPIRELAQGERPKLTVTSAYNAYEEALKITNGNVFRALALLGAIGHDDISNVKSASHLFARNSLGVEVPSETLNRFQLASEKCLGTNGAEECNGAGGTFNYHMIAGAFLGCELAKKGFDKGYISTMAVNLFRGATQGFFDEKMSRCETRSGRLGKEYCVNLSTDIPEALGYFYKKTTMPQWLSADAKFLFNHGYTKPFMFQDGKFAIPKEWASSEEGDVKKRMEKAVMNLDYRLMHLEYGSVQHRVGAEFGARVCREYKYRQDIRPQGLSVDAAVLYDLGYFNSGLSVSNLKRAPKEWNRARLQAAWDELHEKLKAKGSRYGYEDRIGTALDGDENVKALLFSLFDWDAQTPDTLRKLTKLEVSKVLDGALPLLADEFIDGHVVSALEHLFSILIDENPAAKQRLTEEFQKTEDFYTKVVLFDSFKKAGVDISFAANQAKESFDLGMRFLRNADYAKLAKMRLLDPAAPGNGDAGYDFLRFLLKEEPGLSKQLVQELERSDNRTFQYLLMSIIVELDEKPPEAIAVICRLLENSEDVDMIRLGLRTRMDGSPTDKLVQKMIVKLWNSKSESVRAAVVEALERVEFASSLPASEAYSALFEELVPGIIKGFEKEYGKTHEGSLLLRMLYRAAYFDDRALRFLENRLEFPGGGYDGNVLAALDHLGKRATSVLPRLLGILDKASEVERYNMELGQLIGHIAAYEPKIVLKKVASDLNSTNGVARYGAVRIAYAMGPAAMPLKPLLLKMLQDEAKKGAGAEAELERSLVVALARIAPGDSDVLDALLSLFSPKRLATEDVATALKPWGEKAAKVGKVVLNVYSEIEDFNKGPILEFLVTSLRGDPNMLDIVKRAVASKNPGLRETAIAALDRLGPRADVLLPEIIHQSRIEERGELKAILFEKMINLGKDHAEIVVPALIDILKNDRERDVEGVARLLGSFGKEAKDALPILKEIKNEVKYRDWSMALTLHKAIQKIENDR